MESRAVSLPELQPGPLRQSQVLRSISSQADPPVDSIQDVSDYVYLYKRKHNKELTLRRFEKAEEVRQMMESFSRQAQRSLFNRRCQTALTDLRSRLTIAEEDKSTISDETTDKLREFDDGAARRMDRMKARHESEWEIHLQQEPTQTPANFRRRSPKLLELCGQERRLFFQGRFDEAAAIRKECEAIDKQEDADAYRKAVSHWNNVGEQLRKKHMKEEEAMKDWVEVRRREIEADMGRQTEAVTKRERLLGTEIARKRKIMRQSAPHAVRRGLLFDRTKSRGTLIPMRPEIDVEKMCEQMPERASEILLGLGSK